MRIVKLMTAALMATAFSGTSAMAAGAVVVAPDRSVLFWSLHQRSVGIAVDLAMSSCAARFTSCTIGRTFDHGCLGVARSPNHRVWGYAARDTPGEARLAAIGQCAQYGASCMIQIVSCE
ncbi:MAG: DUF4189 domain-containing protein [Hyphomicrobiales bacterium]